MRFDKDFLIGTASASYQVEGNNSGSDTWVMVAQNCGAGFLGGIVGGIFVGIVVLLMKKVKVPKTFNALWSIIVIPVVATVLGDLLIEFAVGKVIVAATGWVTSIASGLGTGNMALIGLVFGIIGALDLGLFCNKALSSVPFALMATIDPATGLPIMAYSPESYQLIYAAK